MSPAKGHQIRRSSESMSRILIRGRSPQRLGGEACSAEARPQPSAGPRESRVRPSTTLFVISRKIDRSCNELGYQPCRLSTSSFRPKYAPYPDTGPESRKGGGEPTVAPGFVPSQTRSRQHVPVVPPGGPPYSSPRLLLEYTFCIGPARPCPAHRMTHYFAETYPIEELAWS